MGKIDKLMEKYGVNENSTDKAAGTLKAIIGALEKRKNLDDKGKEVLAWAKGVQAYYDKEGSFSPAQAEGIANTAKTMPEFK